jgi:hypothetical protein
VQVSQAALVLAMNETQPTFRVALPSAVVVPDVLGIWQVTASAGAFGARALGAEAGLHWQVGLPDNLRAASAILAQQEALLRLDQTAAVEAEARLAAFVAGLPPPGAPVSFDLSQQPWPEAERELAVWVQAVRGPESFWPGQAWLAGWQEIEQQAKDFLEQVRLAIRYYAWVESSLGVERLGRTTVGWLGSVETVWLGRLDDARADIHRRALAVTLETRMTWLRLALQISVGAARLAAVVSSGGVLGVGSLAAAWNFLRQVLAEVQKLRA